MQILHHFRDSEHLAAILFGGFQRRYLRGDRPVLAESGCCGRDGGVSDGMTLLARSVSHIQI